MIVIPSYNRPTCPTLSGLSDVALSQTVLLVHPNQAKEYASRHPKVQVLSTRKQGHGAAEIRQFILDNFIGCDVLIMLDDDLQFKYCNEVIGGRKRFKKADPEIVEANLNWAAQQALIHGCVLRLGSCFFNTYPEPIGWGRRGWGGFILADCHDCRFDGIDTMEDIHFYCQLLSKGIRVGQLNHLCVTSTNIVGGEGQALVNRSKAHESAAKQLSSMYPKYIKLRDASKNKEHMRNIGTPVDISFMSRRMFHDYCR